MAGAHPPADGRSLPTCQPKRQFSMCGERPCLMNETRQRSEIEEDTQHSSLASSEQMRARAHTHTGVTTGKL